MNHTLGDWLKRRTGRANMRVWMGECHVHAGIRPDEVAAKQAQYAGADLLIHPECGCASACVWGKDQGMMAPNTYVLSTEGMVRHAAASPNDTFIVATETGILHRLHKEMPGKRFIAADDAAVCRYMKQITLQKLRDTLRDLAPRVAARLQVGLTGDCIGLEVDSDGEIAMLKPSLGGMVVAPIYSKTKPVMATVRPGMLEAVEPDWNVRPHRRPVPRSLDSGERRPRGKNDGGVDRGERRTVRLRGPRG